MISWPGRIRAGSTSDLLTYFPDFLPTFAELAGAEDLVPTDVDGVSIVPTLLDAGVQEEHEALYFEYYGTDPNRAPEQAIRWGDWKMIIRRSGGVELYDLATDPRESRNVAGSHQAVVSRIREIAAREHTPMRPQFNVNPPTVGNASKDGVVSFGIRPVDGARRWTASLSGDASSLAGSVVDAAGRPVRLYLDDLDVRYALGLELELLGDASPALELRLRGNSGFVYFRTVLAAGVLERGVPASVAVELELTGTTPSASQLGGDLNKPLRLEISHDAGPGALSATVRFLRDDGGEFRRADCNGDGGTDLSDAVHILVQLFQGGGAPRCRDACDSNDDGSLDLSDAVYTLSFLFVAGEPPPPPRLECGADPTKDGLDCLETPAGCGNGHD
jgi:hypothetical protein